MFNTFKLPSTRAALPGSGSASEIDLQQKDREVIHYTKKIWYRMDRVIPKGEHGGMEMSHAVLSYSQPFNPQLGGREDPINEAGLEYYSDLVDLLLSNRIEPWVTIFHWDTPKELDDRYGAWRNSEEKCQGLHAHQVLSIAHPGSRDGRTCLPYSISTQSEG